MPCFSPIKGWYSKKRTENGKRQVVFSISQANVDMPAEIPCGGCIGCRLERSRQWAIRCHHEASLHKENSFITLTYDEQNLPSNGSLDIRDLQLFLKRLRAKNPKKTIRYYACGEYGDKGRRPHYHACLFGHDFPDKTLWKRQENKEPLYRSELLEKLWPYGYSSIGEVTFQSAAYVARYIMKKLNGEMADRHYTSVDTNGVIHEIKPEFTTMSRRPGVGHKWLAKYASDIYPDDFVIIGGKRMRPPRYYDTNYEIIEPKKFKSLRRLRKKNLKKHAGNNTPERLAVRQEIQERKLEQLPRNHDQ